MQTFIAILLVLACGGYVAWQLLRTVRAGNGKAGACCSHGCGGHEPTPAATAATSPATPREHFIASDTLRRRK